MEAIAHAFERVDERTDISRLVELNQLVMSFDKSVALEVEALSPLPGLGEPRIAPAVKAFEQSKTAKYLLIGGAHTKELTYEDLSMASLRRNYGLRRRKGVLVEHTTDHTAEQVDWVMQQTRDLEVSSLAIFTSPYHLLRAFATAIKSMNKLEMNWIPIIPIWTGCLLDRVPEHASFGWNTTGADLVAGEVDRFNGRYPGDVASYEETMAYLRWLHEHHPALMERI